MCVRRFKVSFRSFLLCKFDPLSRRERMAGRRWLCLLAAGAQQACSTRVPVVHHDALLHANGTLRVDTSVDVPRFDPGPEALAYMREQGYVVIRGVANASELAHARELLWAFLEGAGVGAVRDRPESWIRSAPNQYGIVWEYGVGQSRLMWFLRTRPRLLRMFSLVWGTSDLITSFEGFSMFPPAAQVTANYSVGAVG